MSLRDEMMQAISSHPLDDSAATDAALVVVRSHVNRLADELDDKARDEARKAAECRSFGDIDGMALHKGRSVVARKAARRVRAICEEQMEDEK